VTGLTILAVGRLRSFYREACDEYRGRIARHTGLVEVEVRESRRTGSREETETDEARRLLEKLPARSVLVALTREGEPWSSRTLAGRLELWQAQPRPVAFAIGGSTGLGEAVLERAELRWSLGPLTLPHELARVVVYEQLYRAFTMLRGEPYHKGRA